MQSGGRNGVGKAQVKVSVLSFVKGQCESGDHKLEGREWSPMNSLSVQRTDSWEKMSRRINKCGVGSGKDARPSACMSGHIAKGIKFSHI